MAALAVAATIAATTASLALPTVAADAATANSCSYGTGGTNASGLCWLDFTGYNDATALGAGQQFTEAIPGGYTMSFTLTRTASAGSPAVAAATTPTWNGTPFGNPAGGEYGGISGHPALYAQNTFSTPNHAGTWTVTLSDVQITDSAGKVMSGWTLNAADAESANVSERETWRTNGNGWQIANSIPALNGGTAACPVGVTGTGTTTLVCTGGNGSSTSGSGNNVGDIVASTSGGPTLISATAEQNYNNNTGAGGQSGFAFAVSTASITLNKNVAGRVSSTDQFTVATTDQGGTQIGTATTTGAATTAGTGSKTVIAGSVYTLGETAAATADLSNYSQSWSCSNASTGSSTTLPPPGSTGTSQAVTPQPGDTITCTVTNTPPPASLSLVKSADPSGPDDFVAGQPITYSFTVTNTGGVTLDDLTVTDTDFSGTGTLSAIACPVTTLAPGASTTCTATYALTTADVNAGQVTNTATANGNTPENTPVPSNPSSALIPIIPDPALTLAKTATPTTIAEAGDTVSYSFLVTNTGNVTLAAVGVAETAFSGTGTAPAISCPPGAASLAPGASVTCTASYTATQADVDAGSITNTAIATGTPPSGTPVDSPPSSATVTASPSPAIAIVKSATPSGASAYTAGQQITYSFVVTNTGNVTLTGVTVDDTDFTGTGAMSAITCPVTTLEPGASTTCTATYTLTQADVDRGTTTNAATATGTPPSGTPPVSPPSTVTIPAAPAPAITVVKSSDRTGITSAGQTIGYSFLVTNTGNVTLTGVTVDDTDFTGTGVLSAIACPATTLVPGASTTCTATYTVTQADVDAGGVTNTATATGTPPGDTPPPVSPPSTVDVPATPAPGISVVKTADLTEITAAGQTIDYSFSVVNTGNVTLTDITIDDGTFTGTGTLSAVACPVTTLAPGQNVICTASYVTTQADLDGGGVTNTATATGTPPGDTPPPVSPPSTVEVPSDPAPAITIVKSADPSGPSDFQMGQTIDYSFVVTNTGNVTLTDVTVHEGDFTGTGNLSAVSCPAGAAALAPGASVICTASYQLTQADIDAGSVRNAATATGTPPAGDPPVSPPSEVTIPETPAPGIALVKTADRTEITAAGQVIEYSFLVTNTGNVTLTNPAVDDGDFSGTGTLGPVSCPTEPLVPGASTTCTATYVTTQADLDDGGVTNTATATGTPPGDTPPPVSPPSTVKVPSTPTPGISILKTADPTTVHHAGDTVTYSFAVTNTGNVTLTNVTVDDTTFSGTGSLSAIDCPPGAAALAPGASVTCTATYVVTQADVDAGSIANTATATGTPPPGVPPVTSPPSSTTVTAPPDPAITVVKTVSPSGQSTYTVGQELTYSFVVTNTGNTTLTDVTVSDTDFTGSGPLSAIACPAGAASLAPGASITCTAAYTLTQADIDAGSVTNTAIATGTPPGTTTPPVSPPSTVTVPSPPAPALTVTKTANVTTITAAGQTIGYSFVVTNIGNVTITDPVVEDGDFTGTGQLSAITCPAAASPLAPGVSVACTATYVTTAADVASGELSNTATVTGTTPTGDPTPPSPPSTVTVPVHVPAPVVSVETGGTAIAPAGGPDGLPTWLGLLGAGMIGLAGVGAAVYRRRRSVIR